jgi:hypothetical protein
VVGPAVDQVPAVKVALEAGGASLHGGLHPHVKKPQPAEAIFARVKRIQSANQSIHFLSPEKRSGVDVMITIFCDFRRKNWRFFQKPML